MRTISHFLSGAIRPLVNLVGYASNDVAPTTSPTHSNVLLRRRQQEAASGHLLPILRWLELTELEVLPGVVRAAEPDDGDGVAAQGLRLLFRPAAGVRDAAAARAKKPANIVAAAKACRG